MTPVEPWVAAWGDGYAGSPMPADPAPPTVMPPSGMCCTCPGADSAGCCAHMEWRRAFTAHMRLAADAHPTTQGRQGRARRWWRSMLIRHLAEP